MSPESTKVESAKYNPRPWVSRETLFLSSASLRWWDMATPKAALQALLDRRFELVCNGWVPVTTEPRREPAVKVSALNRCGAAAAARRHPPPPPPPPPWKKLGISPIKLLFGDRVDMSKVCHWFMQTTETRSLAIAKGATLSRRLRAKGGTGGRAAPAKRRKRRRRRRWRGPEGLTTGPRGRPADRGLAAPGRGRRRAYARRREGGCDPQRGGPINWLSRHHVERCNGCGVCRREEPPPPPPPDGDEAGAPRPAPDGDGDEAGAPRPQPAHATHQVAVAAAALSSPQPAWTLLDSPPVLSVTGTNYKLVPVGNALPDPEKMQVARAAEETLPRGDSSCQRPRPFLLGCLRECWVILRNIEEPKKRAKQNHTCSEEKLAEVFQERRRRRKSLNPLKVVGYSQPDADPWATGQEVPPETPPSAQSGLDIRPTSPTLLDCAKRSDEQKQRDNLLADDVQWQLVGLKECKVILRKINVLDRNYQNGCVGKQLSKVPSPTQSLERKVCEESGAEVEHQSEFHDASFCQKTPSQWRATNNCIACAGAVDFAKRKCSAGELNPRESDVKNKAKETFTVAKWSQLKECKVVLEKITPLVGNRFSTVADDQLFRFGWNINRDTSNC